MPQRKGSAGAVRSAEIGDNWLASRAGRPCFVNLEDLP